MDGLAATLATVACAYFAVDAATVHENDLVLVLSLSLGFACLGFLPFNLRPGSNAAVFMGDAGSQLLGFLLAALGLAASWTTAGTTVATMLLPLLVLAMPILDTTLVTVKRLHEKRPVTQGGRDHTSHRLVYYGLSESKAVGLLALIAVALGATAVAYNVLDRPAVTAVGVLLSFVLLVQFGAFLAELSEDARAGRPGDTRLRHALTVEPRRLVEVLVDFALTCTSFFGAYVLVVGGTGGEAQRGTFLAALPIVLGARYVGFVAFRHLPAGVALRDPAGLRGAVVACVVSELVAFGIVVATRRLGDFPARVFLVDLVLFATLAVLSPAGAAQAPPRGGRCRDGRVRSSSAPDAAGRGIVRELPLDGRSRRRVRGRRPAPGSPTRARDPGGRPHLAARGRDRVACGRSRHPPRRRRRPGGRSRARHLPSSTADVTVVPATPRGASATTEQGNARRRPSDAMLALVGAYLLLCCLFLWQAWRRETPTIFTDELELTQLSRSIAETGQPARRGVATRLHEPRALADGAVLVDRPGRDRLRRDQVLSRRSSWQQPSSRAYCDRAVRGHAAMGGVRRGRRRSRHPPSSTRRCSSRSRSPTRPPRSRSG